MAEAISTIAKGLFDLAIEMAQAIGPALWTAFMFLLWVLSALIILPCVFVAGTLFPLWEEWAKEF